MTLMFLALTVTAMAQNEQQIKNDQISLPIEYTISENIAGKKIARFGDSAMLLSKVYNTCDETNQNSSFQLAGIRNAANVWPKGRIPYEFDQRITEDISKFSDSLAGLYSRTFTTD